VAVNTSLGAYRVVQLRARNPFGVRFYDNENYRNSDTAPNAS
jgi:hypothetical protein